MAVTSASRNAAYYEYEKGDGFYVKQQRNRSRHRQVVLCRMAAGSPQRDRRIRRGSGARIVALEASLEKQDEIVEQTTKQRNPLEEKIAMYIAGRIAANPKEEVHDDEGKEELSAG